MVQLKVPLNYSIQWFFHHRICKSLTWTCTVHEKVTYILSFFKSETKNLNSVIATPNEIHVIYFIMVHTFLMKIVAI